MSVSMLFEVRASEDEALHATLAEISALPHWERELMTAQIMRFEADRRAEKAAGALALERAEEQRQARIRATRERNRHKSGDPS